MCLNPCCSGQWSRTRLYAQVPQRFALVLVLVVVDNGLVQMVLKGTSITS